MHACQLVKQYEDTTCTSELSSAVTNRRLARRDQEVQNLTFTTRYCTMRVLYAAGRSYTYTLGRFMAGSEALLTPAEGSSMVCCSQSGGAPAQAAAHQLPAEGSPHER